MLGFSHFAQSGNQSMSDHVLKWYRVNVLTLPKVTWNGHSTISGGLS